MISVRAAFSFVLVLSFFSFFTGCTVQEYPYYLARNLLNISLVIDRSGSMGGDRIVNAQKAAKAIVDELNENDILSIVTFADGGILLVESQYVVVKEEIKNHIDTISAGGGTYVSSGLTLSYQELNKHVSDELENSCILICDGDVDEGAVGLAQNAYTQGIRTTSIAIGEGADTERLQRVAEEGHGVLYTVTDASDLEEVFIEEIQNLLSPIE